MSSTDVLTGQEQQAQSTANEYAQQINQAQINPALHNVNDQLKNATTAKEIVDNVDTVVVNYLDLMFDTIDRQSVIYPLYKTMINHAATKIGKTAPYQVFAKVASTAAIDLLGDLAEMDHIFMTEEELHDIQ